MVLCRSLARFASLYVLSSCINYTHLLFAISLIRKRELVALLLLYFWMSCYCKYSVALSHSAVGWSTVCDCGIS